VLKNTFRKLTGILILLVMGVAVFQYVRATEGSPLVASALGSGLKLLLFLGLVLYVVFLFDRRLKKNQR
jgi:hypothetical protein